MKKKLTKHNFEDLFALTPMQGGLLFHYLKDNNSDLYFEQICLVINADIQWEIFKKAWELVVENNEMLRVVFRWENLENPVQIILKEHKLKPVYHDFSGYNANEKERKLEEAKTNDRKQKFDLREVPFRVMLCKLKKTGYVIVISNHHILYDGWSTGIVLREFFKTYTDLAEGKEFKKPLKTKFREYVNWIQSQDKQKQREFWKGYLKGIDTSTNLPVKKSGVLAPIPGTYTIELSKDLKDRTEAFTKGHKITLATLLYSAWGILLQRYTNCEDVIFGTTVSGRNIKIRGIEETIGLFINTIPLRIRTDSNEKVAGLLNRVDNDLRGREEYETASLANIKGHSELAGNEELFNSVVVIENYPLDSWLMQQNSSLPVASYSIVEMTNYDLVVNITVFDRIEAAFSYNRNSFDEDTVIRLGSHFRCILENVLENPGNKAIEVEIMTEEERNGILYRFNDTEIDYPKDKTISRLFAEQVKRSPDSIAVVGNRSIYTGLQVSYSEMQRKSGYVAQLLKRKVAVADTIVGIMLERSVEMIIGIMGILTAGSAYLPIDPHYPDERILFMLMDSSTFSLLTNGHLLKNSQKVREWVGEKILLEELQPPQFSVGGDDKNRQGVNLAYIIYTSGSTGRPKGVMIEHRSVVNRINWMQREYPLAAGDVILQKTPFTFDVSVWELFWWSFQGASLNVLGPNEERDPEAIVKAIAENQITVMHFVPSMLTVFLEYVGNSETISLKALGSLKQVFSSGEALTVHQVDRFNTLLYRVNNTKLCNLYGPTEATVDVSYFNCSPGDKQESKTIPIGKPIDNIQLLVMNKQLHLQPIGIPGELCIGGDGLARGYLNRPELTADKFCLQLPAAYFAKTTSKPHKNFLYPYSTTQRLNHSTIYRTGDLARWLCDGNIEFLGRSDFQIKIRGIRIELEEIECRLLTHDKIKEAVVIAAPTNVEFSNNGNNTGNDNLLYAYIVLAKEYTLTQTELREHLAGQLPGYMIPNYFVVLEKIPLTLNGKLDRKALPHPQIQGSTELEKPHNEVERKLAEIWESVLGVESVGINDNFFTLGGDSIKAIRISGIIQKYGLRLEIKDLMLNPTIKQASRCVNTIIHAADQSIVAGNVELTPIQRWFFENHLTDRSHFNLSVLLQKKTGFAEEIVKTVFTRLIEHHDALRMRYVIKPDGIFQVNKGIDCKLFDLEVIYPSETREVFLEIEGHANRIQKEIDLYSGPLVKLGLFKIKDNDHLLIVTHHLVIDGISWRILLEDFSAAYDQAQKGEEIKLKNKTTSFKEWAQRIKKYSESPEALKNLEYWGQVEKEIVNLQVDIKIAAKREKNGSLETIVVPLEKKETRQLLREVNQTYNTGINDILLTALALSLKKWTGLEKTVIAVEGHGRESVIADVDVSRTMGWFTSLYPVLLHIGEDETLSYAIKSVKENLKRIPDKGLGYGILKYLTRNESVEVLKPGREAEISFNYLGDFDGDNKSYQGIFKVVGINIGENVSRRTESPFKLQIYGMIIGEKLTLYFTFDNNLFRPETIRRLADSYTFYLQDIIEHCIQKEEIELTPSDVNVNGLTIRELEELENKIGKNKIQNIYRLTPMQQGMFFHFLTESTTTEYFEQIDILLKGEIEKSLLEKSFNILVDRYDILRTCFEHEVTEEPLQIVLKKRKLRIDYTDLSGMREDQRENYLQGFKKEEFEKGFNLVSNNSMRIFLFKTDEGLYTLFWNFHHIILDGWSIGIIFKEILQVYRALTNGKTAELGTVIPYGQYVQWIENQDKKKGLRYWQEYLLGYEQSAGLPKAIRTNRKGKYKKREYPLIITDGLTKELEGIAKLNHVTLSEVFQALWGLLLHRYTNQGDVVFGMVVSGRHSGIEGIESMVGLFINTVPLRVKMENREKFLEILEAIHIKSALSKPYEYVSLADIQASHPLKEQLIDHILVFENYPIAQEFRQMTVAGENGIGFRVEDTSIYEQTNYDFNIVISPGKSIVIDFNFNSLIYEIEFIERIAKHFETLINQVVKTPGISVEEIEILTPAEKYQLLYEFNETKVVYPREQMIHELFASQVERIPDQVALVIQIPKHKSQIQTQGGSAGYVFNVFGGLNLSYRALNEKCNRLACRLIENGVTPDMNIGIMAERSIEMIIGILGILKSGGAYLPIDPGYPKDRINYMLSDSKTKLLVTDRPVQGRKPCPVPVLDLVEAVHNRTWNQPIGTAQEVKAEGEPPVQTKEWHSPTTCNPYRSLAYIIYTSGSTGRPKGVMIEHPSVVNRINWMQRNYPLAAGDVILQKTPITFDVSVWELFWWFFGGAALHLLGPGEEKDPEAIVKAIVKNQVTVMHFVPSMLNVFLEYVGNFETSSLRALGKLKHVFSSGEALTVHQVERFNALLYGTHKTKLVNLYGPTEATVDVSYFNCSPETIHQGKAIPIGKPIDNIQLLVMNKQLHLQPIGIPGELCIGGDGLARGYLNRPELTREKFVEYVISFEGGDIPFGRNSNTPGESFLHRINSYELRAKLYKTGDLARWLMDGNIDFLGRIDHQVKIRGYRIEPEEIEIHLCKYDGIKETAVIIRENPMGDKYLCAYIVSNSALDISKLREYLSKAFPEYMIPSYFGFIDKIPLTAHGKIDKKALPAPELKAEDGYIAPRNLVEKKLAAIWSDVLEIEVGLIGTDSNFFELGGHSLKATLLIVKIHKTFNTKIPLSYIFKTPSLKGIAQYIKEAGKDECISIDPAEKKEYYPLSSAQKRLYLLQQVELQGTSYNMPHILPLWEELEIEKLEETFRQIINRHESFRTSFHLVNDEPVQKVHEIGTVEIMIERVEHPANQERDTQILKDFLRPFDLSGAPLLRIGIAQSTEDRQILLIDLHHIVFDGTSRHILETDFALMYKGGILPHLRIQYKDFALWQIREKNNLYQQEKFWLTMFAEEPPELNLSIDYPRQLLRNFEGSTIRFEISPDKTNRLRTIAQETNATLYMVLLTIITIFVSKLGGRSDVVIGTPIAGRNHADLEKIIGMFVNTLALRNYPKDEKTVKEFLLEVKQRTLDAFENQDYQFEDLVDKVAVTRDSSRNPLFDVMYTLQNYQGIQEENSDRIPSPGNTNFREDVDIDQEPYEYQSISSKFDITFIGVEMKDKLVFTVEYCTKLFKKEKIIRFIGYLEELISTVISNQEILLKDINLSHGLFDQPIDIPQTNFNF